MECWNLILRIDAKEFINEEFNIKFDYPDAWKSLTSFISNFGIEYDSNTRTYTFIINKYFEDFKIAVNNFIYGLESGNEDLSQFKDVIESKPMLI